jgi:hypothetical protein
VTIPDHDAPVEHSCEAGKSHKFTKKGAPLYVKLKLLDTKHQPRKNVRYELAFGDAVRRGTTDGDGFVREKLPAHAERGLLTLFAPNGEDRFEILLGHLDPIEDAAGVQERLANLGYDDGTEHGVWTESKRALLRAFQAKEGLTVTGEPDADTRSALARRHGC